MNALTCILLLSASAAPAMAAAQVAPTQVAPPQAAPMTEPPPRMVVQWDGYRRRDRTARPPAMGQSTHDIMMPAPDMPRPAASGGAQAKPSQGAAKPSS